MADYKKVKVVAGPGGYGGPIYIEPTEERPYICCMTGMSMHKVAKEIAALTGGELVSVFMKKIPPEKMACIVLDCGGCNRAGTYPALGVKTIDIYPVKPTGANVETMTPDIFVTGVSKPKFVTLEA